MMLLVVGTLTAVVSIGLLVYLVYSGMFMRVEISTGRPPIGRVVVAYRYTTGSYDKCGKLIGEFCKLDPNRVCIGLYYANPDEVPAEKLKWAVGQIVARGEEEVDEEVRQKYEAAGCAFITLPEIRAAITAKFHQKNSTSLFFGMRSFYTRLMSYIKEKGLPKELCIELYEGDIVRFMVPLEEQASFVVPEARQKTSL